MLLEKLRQEVWKCNLDLPKNGLVKMTSGNVSGRDPESNLVVIKPSGFSYEEMTPAHMVVVSTRQSSLRLRSCCPQSPSSGLFPWCTRL